MNLFSRIVDGRDLREFAGLVVSLVPAFASVFADHSGLQFLAVALGGISTAIQISSDRRRRRESEKNTDPE